MAYYELKQLSRIPAYLSSPPAQHTFEPFLPRPRIGRQSREGDTGGNPHVSGAGPRKREEVAEQAGKRSKTTGIPRV